jgi:biopolymer transport protein TolR
MPGVVSRSSRGRRTINEINMVPFIDVMLVLLIIFMVTAPLITPSVVNLPSVGKAAQQPDKVITVVVGKDGQLQLTMDAKTSPVSLKELGARVKQSQGAGNAANVTNVAPVVISADKEVKYESVVAVMDQLQRSGVQRVGLSVQLAK